MIEKIPNIQTLSCFLCRDSVAVLIESTPSIDTYPLLLAGGPGASFRSIRGLHFLFTRSFKLGAPLISEYCERRFINVQIQYNIIVSPNCNNTKIKKTRPAISLLLYIWLHTSLTVIGWHYVVAICIAACLEPPILFWFATILNDIKRCELWT